MPAIERLSSLFSLCALTQRPPFLTLAGAFFHGIAVPHPSWAFCSELHACSSAGAVSGLTPGGQVQGPEVGPESGFTAMITVPFVIIAVKPETELEN